MKRHNLLLLRYQRFLDDLSPIPPIDDVEAEDWTFIKNQCCIFFCIPMISKYLERFSKGGKGKGMKKEERKRKKGGKRGRGND